MKRENLIIGVVALIFMGWALLFIYNTSFPAIDGQRYFALFDDAMISMRYADNLAHGKGLVWNEGERVEGYTNLLMVLIMAVPNAFLEKRFAVLSIQLLGVITMLAIAWLNMQIALQFSDQEDDDHRRFLKVISFAAPLMYYPLAYWSLMGMETGLLSVLLLFSLYALFKNWSVPMALALGLAYWTRPETFIVSGMILAYFAYYNRNRALPIFLIYLILPVIQHIFRWQYYGGEIFANTYTLKVTGVPFIEKWRNGMGFILPFLDEHFPILLIIALGLMFNISQKKLLLAGLVFVPIAYQVSVGGDPWLYWRIMSPTMPLALALMAHELLVFFKVVFEYLQKFEVDFSNRKTLIPAQYFYAVCAIIVCFWFAKRADFRLIREQLLIDRPYLVVEHSGVVNISIAINDLTTEDATIGVFWAGIIPYYTDRYAIDFWGKSDPYIANLPPDLSGRSGWNGMNSVPGHAKYDLNYSIVELQPTYVQHFIWAQQDLIAWGAEHYETVYYRGIEVKLRKGDDRVRWDVVENLNE